MISTGIDLVLVTRFEKLVNNETFIKQNFTDNEIEYIKKSNSSEVVASLYASKEALLKALGKGINDYPIKDIEIIHSLNKAPYIVLHNELKKNFDITNHSLSVSHDGGFIVAVVSILK